MTLQQLKYAVYTAKYHSISDAAKSLFISQPSLTAAIKELESEINITIFNRNNKGISVSPQGEKFLGYARQVLEQMNLLEEEYLQNKPKKQQFSVSTQHYSFAVDAFVDVIKKYGENEYEFTLRETKTYEIIEDVSKLRSEIGILYLNDYNKTVIQKLIQENDLKFERLFQSSPHIFISNINPLAKQDSVSLEDLEEYPYLSFEQGNYNSFYFSEEILSTLSRKKCIKVSDRATLFNLLIGLNGYTICTGIISEELNGPNIVAVPLRADETIEVGAIMHKNIFLSRIGNTYLSALKKHTNHLP